MGANLGYDHRHGGVQIFFFFIPTAAFEVFASEQADIAINHEAHLLHWLCAACKVTGSPVLMFSWYGINGLMFPCLL